MAAQDISLDFKPILDHLRLIESKVKRVRHDEYLPQMNSFTLESITNEANRMLEFAGLPGYFAVVSYENLTDGIGGDVPLNYDRNVNIRISNIYKNNYAATLAILAHEICHKVLFVNHLVFPTTMMTEVHADVTTLYVGFGNLILNGCITHNANTKHYLGYLTYDTYKLIKSILDVIYRRKSVDTIAFSKLDIVTQHALNNWALVLKKRENPEEYLLKESTNDVRLMDSINLLEQMLNYHKVKIYKKLDLIEKELYQYNDLEKLSYDNTIDVFYNYYECILKEDSDEILKKDFEHRLGNDATTNNGEQEESTIIMNAAYDLYNHIDNNSLTINRLAKCPFCGESILGAATKKDHFVIVCPSCKRHFIKTRVVWEPDSHKNIQNKKDSNEIAKLKDEIKDLKQKSKRLKDENEILKNQSHESYSGINYFLAKKYIFTINVFLLLCAISLIIKLLFF